MGEKPKSVKRLRVGTTQKQILLLLLAGTAMGLSGSPKTFFKILSSLPEALREIEEKNVRRAIQNLYRSRLAEKQEHPDGTMTLALTDEGKRVALRYDINKMKVVKPRKWDEKWRIVTFDIPQKARWIRDSLREHLRQLQFYELQKSVFVHPFDCKNEIDYIVEFYNIRRHVRFIIADSIDNELHIMHCLGL
ncbi:MAG: hypothetical protein HYV67_01960 [Candidatus Taylorbacteria bacterium]|nr:hypothetical protein [Candidatus Taylorbacteria bacterium]